MRRRAIALALLGGAGWIACGGGGSRTAPTPVEATGTFTLNGAGYASAVFNYSTANGGLVFCRRQTGRASYLWVRLAAERAADGTNAPHVDMDLCNFVGSTTYRTVHDVTAGLNCTQGETWDLWWHDGPAKTFVSRPSSSPCEATVTRTGTRLQGTFQCHGLTPPSGPADTLDVTAGSFVCDVTG